MSDLDLSGRPSGPPTVTGLSPTEGTPGTQITIRGENLGVDQNDLLMLFICGTDCLHTAKWKSPSKIIARLGQANRGLGEVKLATKSGGRGISHVKFRVFIAQVGPLEETAVWVDESRTVPGREALRMIAPTNDEHDALGLAPSKKIDVSVLQREFPDGSGNLRMESFNPQWYLLENHSDTSIESLREAIKHMELAKADEARKSEKMHKANLYSLICCVDTLANLHDELERGNAAGELAVIKKIGTQITDAKTKAESVFRDVLSRKDKADATRNALSVLTRFKFIFFLSKSIDDNMKKGEYLTILNDYTRAKSLYKDTEVPLFKEVMAQLDAKMENFKEEMKHKLIDTPSSFEEQSKLIKYLKILEPDSDPTWECITSYHCYLEDILWKLQDESYQKALNNKDTRFTAMENNERFTFVSTLSKVLVNKLQSFWKLANTYNTNDERWAQRQDDINQMLTNTINVSSYLLFNCLMRNAISDEILKRYKEQFVVWPPISAEVDRAVLLQSLKCIRSFISSLLDCNFTTAHVQPLIEVCMTIRLKCVTVIIEERIESIIDLNKKEDWKQEFIQQGLSKTNIPDLFENEICDGLSSIREVLSTSGYSGESCLFSREIYRSALHDSFLRFIVSIRRCFDKLLNYTQEMGDELKVQGLTKKFLITVCDVDYLIERTMKVVVRRMNDCGVKYVAEIEKESIDRLLAYRKFLIDCYIKIKCSAFRGLIDCADYCYLPDVDVSDYAKEMIMCCVLQQAELELCAPHLSTNCLQDTILEVFRMLIEHLTVIEPFSQSVATQVVIDLCALEEAFNSFTTLETRTIVNNYRAQLVANVDQRKVAPCLNKIRGSMGIALESLEGTVEDDLNSSHI